MQTSFRTIFDCFFNKITDDMFMELTEQETYDMQEALFKNALHYFEFPRVNIYDYNQETKEYNIELTHEEINIIATYMVVEWIGQQLASIENIREKYSGSDFKFTSQANHMQKLIQLKKQYIDEGFHLQRLYKRRKADSNGIMRSTFRSIMSDSTD